LRFYIYEASELGIHTEEDYCAAYHARAAVPLSAADLQNSLPCQLDFLLRPCRVLEKEDADFFVLPPHVLRGDGVNLSPSASLGSFADSTMSRITSSSQTWVHRLLEIFENDKKDVYNENRRRNEAKQRRPRGFRDHLLIHHKPLEMSWRRLMNGLYNDSDTVKSDETSGKSYDPIHHLVKRNKKNAREKVENFLLQNVSHVSSELLSRGLFRWERRFHPPISNTLAVPRVRNVYYKR